MGMTLEEFGKMAGDSSAVRLVSVNKKWYETDSDKYVREIDILEDKKAEDPTHRLQNRDLMRLVTRAEDVRRQELNVFRMRAMGTEVFPVETGSKTLRDAINEAMREWMNSVEDTHYIIGSVVGPHPFPMMVRDFQSVIGVETKSQCLSQVGKLPDAVVEAMRIAAKRPKDDVVVVCFSGRGDKDCAEVARLTAESKKK